MLASWHDMPLHTCLDASLNPSSFYVVEHSSRVYDSEAWSEQLSDVKLDLTSSRNVHGAVRLLKHLQPPASNSSQLTCHFNNSLVASLALPCSWSGYMHILCSHPSLAVCSANNVESDQKVRELIGLWKPDIVGHT